MVFCWKFTLISLKDFEEVYSNERRRLAAASCVNGEGVK